MGFVRQKPGAWRILAMGGFRTGPGTRLISTQVRIRCYLDKKGIARVVSFLNKETVPTKETKPSGYYYVMDSCPQGP